MELDSISVISNNGRLGTFMIVAYCISVMQIHIHHHHHYDNSLEKLIMAVSAQVQALMDQVKLNTSIEMSADLGIKALGVQITDLANQVAALQAQIAAGGAPLSADDIAALAQSVTDLQTSAATLSQDIPANTQPTPTPVPARAPTAAPTT